MPDPASAVPASELLQVPPGSDDVSVVLNDSHTDSTPDSVPAVVLTVTCCVVKQPVGNVYVISAVPAAAPVMTPPVPADATDGADELQAPPAGEEDNVVVPPVQRASAPAIADGVALTVTVIVLGHPPGAT